MTIADKDTYKTDPQRSRSLFSRIFFSPLFMFYPQYVCIIWYNGRRAKKGLYGDNEWAESSIDVLRALENVGIRVEIDGMDHYRDLTGPAVFIGNHMSTLETMVLPGLIQPVRPVTFVVKKSLVSMPVFGPVMRSRDPVVVGRENPREDLKTVLEEGTMRLKTGRSIIIFPQSTRSSSFKPEEFNSLGIKLALRAEVPVVPVALKTDAWGNGRLLKEFGPIDSGKKVHFSFGAPINVTGRGTAEHQKVMDFITGKLKEWEKEDLS